MTGPVMGEERKMSAPNSPHKPPQGAVFSPEPNAPVSIVKADDIVLGVISATDDAQLLHVEAGLRQRLDRYLGLSVIGGSEQQICQCVRWETPIDAINELAHAGIVTAMAMTAP